MAKIERSKEREEAQRSAKQGANPTQPDAPSNSAQRGATERSEARQRARKVRHPPKLKNYLLHYAKGKYYLINLSLKKKGHEQRY